MTIRAFHLTFGYSVMRGQQELRFDCRMTRVTKLRLRCTQQTVGEPALFFGLVPRVSAEKLRLGELVNLLDALRALEKSTIMTEALGAETVSAYLRLKHDDWTAYSRHLTEWERQTTLDC